MPRSGGLGFGRGRPALVDPFAGLVRFGCWRCRRGCGASALLRPSRHRVPLPLELGERNQRRAAQRLQVAGVQLDAAAADGNNLCGGGYRDAYAQIVLRHDNCGTSDYAIYEAPSSACSPPTAPPGTSNHEQGTAIDFTCNGGGTIRSRSSPCFQWLAANAANYGLQNLPSEPWHWSTDGT